MQASRYVGGQEIKQFATYFSRNLDSSGVRSALELMLRPNEVARYGIDPDNQVRFEEIAPEVYQAATMDRPSVHRPDGWSPTRDEATFAVDFAFRTALQLQRVSSRSSSLAVAYSRVR